MWGELFVDLNLIPRVFLRALRFSSESTHSYYQLAVVLCSELMRGSHSGCPFGPTSKSRVLAIQSQNCSKATSTKSQEFINLLCTKRDIPKQFSPLEPSRRESSKIIADLKNIAILFTNMFRCDSRLRQLQ